MLLLRWAASWQSNLQKRANRKFKLWQYRFSMPERTKTEVVDRTTGGASATSLLRCPKREIPFCHHNATTGQCSNRVRFQPLLLPFSAHSLPGAASRIGVLLSGVTWCPRKSLQPSLFCFGSSVLCLQACCRGCTFLSHIRQQPIFGSWAACKTGEWPLPALFMQSSAAPTLSDAWHGMAVGKVCVLVRDACVWLGPQKSDSVRGHVESCVGAISIQ